MDSSLLERARHEGAPVVDDESATFVWVGEHAPDLIGDFDGWRMTQQSVLARVGHQVWAQTLTLPRDAYVEYAYVFGHGRVNDPFNRRTVDNGLGVRNHYFFMPGAGPTPFVARERGRRCGTVTRHTVHADHLMVGGSRTVYLYHPPVSEPCPLLVVLDGPDYLLRARFARMVDNLIAQGRIQPIALAMVANGGQARYVEYACNDATLAFLMSCVLPLARQQLNLLDPAAHPGAYGILGASMGGLFALYAGLRAPEIFGRVLSQSGAFALGGLGSDPVVYDLACHGNPRAPNIWMDVGVYESLLPANRRMHTLLRERGYDVTYREYSGGHNYTAWRDDVWRGLETLFGSPRVSLAQAV